MPEKMGIAELKSVIGLGLALGELVESLADGVGLSDIGSLLSVAKKVSPAITAIKSGLLLPELKDLSDLEKAELKSYVANEFVLKNESLELAIEKGLHVAIDLSELLKVTV